MSKYKDRYGTPIKLGDTVLQLITLNVGRHSMPFSTRIVKKKSNRLYLDGVHCWGWLNTQDCNHICILNEDTSMSKVWCDFLDLQRKEAKYMPSLYYSSDFLPDEAYITIDEISKLVGKGKPRCMADVKEVVNAIKILFKGKKINLKKLSKVVEKLQEFEEAASKLNDINRDINGLFE